MLIDREESRATVATTEAARTFLFGQHPPAPEMTPEEQEAVQREFMRLLDEMRSRPIDHEAIARQMEEQRGRMGRMMSWLDQCPVPPQQGPTP
ncbi:hypothetical protein [Gemmata sp. SH-PL17]|uniref:hypothetical protein n=1 Tax=Gemmata sp. SH-PL17 TaxID=1630693 RepID=UPI0009EE4114|nr:hypothetical protein [Gemmata sp. SH-PL17]